MRQVYGMNDNKTLIILKKFEGGIRDVQKRENINKGLGLYLDVETTGLNHMEDKVINLAYMIFEYDKDSGEILEVVEKLSQLQDPGKPLGVIIKKITGFVDEDLKGQTINWENVKSDFTRVDLIISHNAYFDRGFIDAKIPISKSKIWACSMDQVDWKGKGHGSRGLEFLAKDHGFFFFGHQALIDVEAGLYLLSLIDPDTSEPYFKELYTNAMTPCKYIIVRDLGYESNNIIKEKGYKWDKRLSAWKIKTSQNSKVEEDFLNKNFNFCNFEIEEIGLEDNYKDKF